jgi:hypothetical protein
VFVFSLVTIWFNNVWKGINVAPQGPRPRLFDGAG